MQNPQDTVVVADPFAMLINPQAVLLAIEQSGRLGALSSRVCRPLDKPLIPKRDQDEQREDQHSYDECIERSHEISSETEAGALY